MCEASGSNHFPGRTKTRWNPWCLSCRQILTPIGRNVLVYCLELTSPEHQQLSFGAHIGATVVHTECQVVYFIFAPLVRQTPVVLPLRQPACCDFFCEETHRSVPLIFEVLSFWRMSTKRPCDDVLVGIQCALQRMTTQLRIYSSRFWMSFWTNLWYCKLS